MAQHEHAPRLGQFGKGYRCPCLGAAADRAKEPGKHQQNVTHAACYRKTAMHGEADHGRGNARMSLPRQGRSGRRPGSVTAGELASAATRDRASGLVIFETMESRYHECMDDCITAAGFP
jgi:hypothetical protein